MIAEGSPTKEELIKYGKPRRFILTKYHFGTDPKRIWDINDIAKLMQQYHQSQLQALKEEVEEMKDKWVSAANNKRRYNRSFRKECSEKASALNEVLNLITSIEENE